jgi:hypothetical protein
MVDVAHDHGETTSSAHLIPLNLIVVTSICLVESGDRLRALAAASSHLLALAAPKGQEHRRKGEVDEQVDGVSPVPADQRGTDNAEDPSKQHQYGDCEEQPGRGSAQVLSRAPEPRGATAVAVARPHRRHPDWTTAQIAARLNIHPNTVRRHLTRAQTPRASMRAPAEHRREHQCDPRRRARSGRFDEDAPIGD